MSTKSIVVLTVVALVHYQQLVVSANSVQHQYVAPIKGGQQQHLISTQQVEILAAKGQAFQQQKQRYEAPAKGVQQQLVAPAKGVQQQQQQHLVSTQLNGATPAKSQISYQQEQHYGMPVKRVQQQLVAPAKGVQQQQHLVSNQPVGVAPAKIQAYPPKQNYESPVKGVQWQRQLVTPVKRSQQLRT